MSAYFIARIRIHDPETYRQYLDGFDAVFERYDAEVVAVDDAPVVLEGDWKHTRVVLIRFSSMDEARRWYDSPEYRSLVRHRHDASVADVVLVEGRD